MNYIINNTNQNNLLKIQFASRIHPNNNTYCMLIQLKQSFFIYDYFN